MCTESLGSETGSDISERSDEFTSLSLKSENTHLTERSKAEKFSKKLTSSASFPPPLTSISGSDNVRVRPCREGPMGQTGPSSLDGGLEAGPSLYIVSPWYEKGQVSQS
ncbi:hypothetical protein ACSBR1_021687 [Camellia fascicularis]